MTKRINKKFYISISMLISFLLWTLAICYIDVKVEGVEVVDVTIEEKLPELSEINIKPETIEIDEERDCDGEINNEAIEEKEEEYLMSQEKKSVENIFESIKHLYKC